MEHLIELFGRTLVAKGHSRITIRIYVGCLKRLCGLDLVVFPCGRREHVAQRRATRECIGDDSIRKGLERNWAARHPKYREERRR